jgi:apolipoprotein N-acyltransferase
MKDRSALSRGGLWAGVSGALLALAFPRADLGAVAFVALVPFLLSLHDVPAVTALFRGYACGGVFFTALLSWIPGVMVTYGGMPRVLAWPIFLLLVFYLATYFAVFALLQAASWRRFGAPALALSPVGWVGLEIVRGRLLTGFPWGLIGYSQYRDIPLLQVSAWGGIYAVSFLVVAANAGLVLLVLRPAKPRPLVCGASLVLLVVLAHAGGALAIRAAERRPDGASIPVAAVQGNVAQDRKWSPDSAPRILSDLVRLTREAGAGGGRLIVWPESSSPYSFHRPAPSGAPGPRVETDEAYASVVRDLARDFDATVIAGSVDYRVVDGDLRVFNSAFAVGPDGALGGPYDKIHLVPFGEYVPLHRVLFFVDRLARGTISDFTPGTVAASLPTRVGRAATFICYEAIFPELVRRVAGKDAALLVSITNDAWFGTTAAPLQHLAMATVRAAENRRFMVRAANTGVSAIIDPYGRILARTPLMESAVLRGTVRTRADVTPYAVCGDLFAWGCAILTLLHGAALRAAFPRRG